MEPFRVAAGKQISLQTTKGEAHRGFQSLSEVQPRDGSNGSGKQDQDVRLGGVLRVSDEKLVSSDYLSSTESSIIDVDATVMLDGKTAKIVAWYDNEYGFANRSECSV